MGIAPRLEKEVKFLNYCREYYGGAGLFEGYLVMILYKRRRTVLDDGGSEFVSDVVTNF